MKSAKNYLVARCNSFGSFAPISEVAALLYEITTLCAEKQLTVELVIMFFPLHIYSGKTFSKMLLLTERKLRGQLFTVQNNQAAWF